MQPYETSTSTISIGGEDYRIRALVDRLQYWDPEGDSERAGVAPASWPFFGVLWPAGIALAEEMSRIPIEGLRILETGCGLGLASLVLRRRGADITASDHHPLARSFLKQNAALNELSPIEFRDSSWNAIDASLGRFDLLIGADLLFERGHPGLLAAFLARHASPGARMIVADPGRGHLARFRAQMTERGYGGSTERVALCDDLGTGAGRGRMLRLDELPWLRSRA